MGRTERMALNGSEIFVIPVVRGLESNKKLIIDEMERITPDIIALSVSPEELDGLLHLEEIDVNDFALSDYEEMYVDKLRRYSRVVFPPPAYTECTRYGTEKKIPLASLDVSERNFSELYVSLVGTQDLILHSLRKKRLRKRKINAESAEDFAVRWDREVNGLHGFREMAERREEYMARRIAKLSEKYEKIAAVVEVERAAGVMARLKSDKPSVSENGHDDE